MGLLHAQSQMGLSDRGPLSAQALAEAALRVHCSLSLPHLSPSLCAHMPVEHQKPTHSPWQGDAAGLVVLAVHQSGKLFPVQASQAGSSTVESQQVSLEGHVPPGAATLLVFRILALAGQQLNGMARSARPKTLITLSSRGLQLQSQ